MHTGSRAFCLLMALAATSSESASAATTVPHGEYCVETKMVSAPASVAKDISSTGFNGYYSDEVISRLVGNPKVSVLSLPRIDSVETLPSRIAVTQDMPLSGGKSREIGIQFKVVANRRGADMGSLAVSFQNIRFAGFSDEKATTPVFSTQRISTTLIVFQDVPAGYYSVNLPSVASLPKTYDADGRLMASIADANERQLLFVKITRG